MDNHMVWQLFERRFESADFATISATERKVPIGFELLEQGPKKKEDIQQYMKARKNAQRHDNFRHGRRRIINTT
jgi:hypothetical protein